MQRLLPMIDAVLKDAGAQLSQLDGLVFGEGPGSFTGLRVAAGVVQGLAYGANLPIIGISSLAALAQGFSHLHSDFTGTLGVAVDARMDEVYVGRFFVNNHGIEAVGPERVLSPSLALSEVLHNLDAACGSGWQLEGLNSSAPSLVAAEIEPDARDFLDLALTGNYQALAAEQARPVYLRDSISWQKRQRIRSEAI